MIAVRKCKLIDIRGDRRTVGLGGRGPPRLLRTSSCWSGWWIKMHELEIPYALDCNEKRKAIEVYIKRRNKRKKQKKRRENRRPAP